MISFPFDNESEEVLDRNISSDVFADYLKRIIGTNGIFADLGTKMQVVESNGMWVTVKAGDGFIEGRLFVEDKNVGFSVHASESLDRIDRVVVRLNKQERNISIVIIKGTAQTVPFAPNVVRAGDIYDLAIADLYVTRNSNTISQSKITDLRLNSTLCGVVPIFGSVDTSTLYTQIQKTITDFELYVKNKMNTWNAQTNEIQAWYDDIRTAIFAKMQLNFDNFIYMPGKTYKTRFHADGSITEKIVNTLTDAIFAERNTTFVGNDILENIKCSEFELNMTKTTKFLSDGNIDAIVTGSVGLLEPSGTGAVTVHNLLSNLSFEKSNHTGFASSMEVDMINQELLGVKENLQRAMIILNGGD